MKRRLWLSLCVVAMCMMPYVVMAQRNNKEAIVQLQKLSRFYGYLNALYVDSVQMAPIVESGIKGMLSELDPHSVYLNAEEMREENESFDGEFSGIGIEFNIHNDSILVINTVAQGPAERVGLLPNDRIVEINSENAVGISRNDVSSKLRGERGTEVNIGVARHGVDEILPFTIVRDKIPITTVDASFLAAEGVGYIKVNRFGRTTMDEFRQAMESMAGIDALILDLCGNGGGLLSQAVDMAGYFLPPRSLVTSMEGRAIPTERLYADEGGVFDGRLVVMIDGSSASGSEIVAGALQDWDRAVIVGRDSFGKGLVQRQIAMGDGSAIRLTVARYHTPSGRVIQRPYERGHKEDYYKAHNSRLTGDKSDSTKDARPEYKTLRRERTVYGGGGIQPDIKVESDTTSVSNYMVKVVAQGVFNEFMMDYMDHNRERLDEQYPTFEKFEAEFHLSDEEMNRLVEMATAKGVEYDEDGYRQSQEYMRNQLTAMIAQRLYTDSEFYRLINPRSNRYYIKAMEVINRWPELGEKTLSPQSE